MCIKEKKKMIYQMSYGRWNMVWLGGVVYIHPRLSFVSGIVYVYRLLN